MSLDEVEPPELLPGTVLVDVRAAAVNFPDWLQIRGEYQEKPALPFTPGLEVAGTVRAAAEESRYRAGDRVLAQAGGGFAEIARAPEPAVQPLPEGMSFAEGAGLYVTYQTGWVALHRRGGLAAGETLLVHAGAGGVGSAAIQLGLAAGARVLATAGSDAKVRVCRELGAETAWNYETQDWVGGVKEATGGRGADVIYDPVGGDVFDLSTRCVAFEGRILVIGFTSGRMATARTNHALIKNYSIVGVHWGLYNRVMPEVVTEAAAAIGALYREGRVRPYISQERPLVEAWDAVQDVAHRRSTGKVVLVP